MIAGLAADEQLIVVKTDSAFKTIQDVVQRPSRNRALSRSAGPPPARKTR